MLSTYDDKKVKEKLAELSAAKVSAQSVLGLNGKQYCPYAPLNSGLTNSAGLSANTVRCNAFLLSEPVTLTEMGVFLVSGGVSNPTSGTRFRFGIIRLRATDLYPETLMAQTNEIIQSATNANYLVSNFNVRLDAGMYCSYIWNNATIAQVFRGIPASGQPIYWSYNPASSTPISRFELTLTYNSAGLPTPFPGGANQANGLGYNPECLFIRTIPIAA